MTIPSTTDIIVAGTGPVGLVAALALSREGFKVALVGPRSGEDRRTTALMTPAMTFLETLGLGEMLRAAGAPLRAMRIVDATARLVRSPPVTFRASEIDASEFGWNIPNLALGRILADAVRGEAAITWHEAMVSRWSLGGSHASAALSDGSTIAAPLVAAADGRLSPAREAAGIETVRQSLPQSALVLNFGHTRDHGFISTEFHTETGPFTQVPLPGRRSSLVWVERPSRAAELASWEDEALSTAIETRMQSMLGCVSVEPGRQIYPLSSVLPRRFAAQRVALLGEAAHVFPPIGAQGLNLGLRDVSDLVAVLRDHRADPGGDTVMSAFDTRRRLDVVTRSAGVGLLNHSLLSGFLPMQLARSATLGALDRFAPLRALFMRNGLGGGARPSA